MSCISFSNAFICVSTAWFSIWMFDVHESRAEPMIELPSVMCESFLLEEWHMSFALFSSKQNVFLIRIFGTSMALGCLTFKEGFFKLDILLDKNWQNEDAWNKHAVMLMRALRQLPAHPSFTDSPKTLLFSVWPSVLKRGAFLQINLLCPNYIWYLIS